MHNAVFYLRAFPFIIVDDLALVHDMIIHYWIIFFSLCCFLMNCVVFVLAVSERRALTGGPKCTVLLNPYRPLLRSWRSDQSQVSSYQSSPKITANTHCNYQSGFIALQVNPHRIELTLTMSWWKHWDGRWVTVLTITVLRSRTWTEIRLASFS